MPGLRRLRDPHRDPAPVARARRAAGEPRVRVGHRVRGAPAVLHEHLRRAQHPRPCARGRDRRRVGPPRPRRVGHRRRRRHVVDRRQPPHPRAASQRESQDPDVQQPDLRPHQGPVLADERGRQDHQVDAVRVARPPVQPHLDRARRRGELRRPHARHGSQAHDGDLPSCARAPGRVLHRGVPELQRLQRRGVRHDPQQGRTAGHAHRPEGTASRCASAPTASTGS